MGFRPRLWPTVFTVPAIVIMLGLGVWQLQRLAWKTEIIETFDARVAGDPVAPPAEVDDIERWRFTRVGAIGSFLHDRELQITGKPYKGTAGFHVITPFVTDNGLTVFVNRGWVPEDRRRPEMRPETLLPPPVTIDGIIREAGVKGRFVPENEPQNDVWFVVRPAAMADHLGLTGPVANYFIDEFADAPRPTRLPFGAAREITVRNDHLQYAITWFLLAITLALVYVVWHRQLPKKEDTE